MKNKQPWSKRNKNKITRSLFLRGIIAPLIYIVLLVVVCTVTTPFSVYTPISANSSDEIRSVYYNGNSYISTTIPTLYYTGYSEEYLGRIVGYYYYGNINNECVFYLLSPSSCDNGAATIDSININAMILDSTDRFSDMLSHFSEDLNWTLDGLKNSVFPYLISQPDYHKKPVTILLIFYASTGIFALICIIINIIRVRQSSEIYKS